MKWLQDAFSSGELWQLVALSIIILAVLYYGAHIMAAY